MTDTLPPTCILTGADGENPDDCTTHDHEDDSAQSQVVGKYRIRLAYAVNGTEFMVCVYDPRLFVNEAAFEQGEDYYCVYGPTALAAVEAAVDDVQKGNAERHFAKVRQEFGVSEVTA